MANGANFWDLDDKIKYFWARIDKRGEDECWPWMGPVREGYGVIKFERINYDAHRIAWEIQNNQCLTRNMLVTQNCGNLLCCNKHHLYVRTRRKLQIEEVKSRSHYPLILTEDQVHEIRQLFATGKYKRIELASKYGVNRSTITDIISGRNWNWLPVLDAEMKKV